MLSKPRKIGLGLAGLVSLLCLHLVGCGVLIGNPEDETDFSGIDGGPSNDSPTPHSGDASKSFEELAAVLLQDYLSSTLDQEPGGIDCDRFEANAETTEIEAGRECVRMALGDCNPAKFYIRSITNSSGDEYASFVRVTKESGVCTLRVRTVSNDEALFLGDIARSCTDIGPEELPEFACGISSFGN